MQTLRVFCTSWRTSFPVFPIADPLSCWVLLFCIGRSGCACLSAEFLGCSRHPQGWWLLGIHRSIDSMAWHSTDSYHTHLTWGASCRTLSDSECEGAWNSNWSNSKSSSCFAFVFFQKYRWDSPCYEWSSRLRLVITGDKRPAALCISIICIVWLKMRLQIYDHRFRGNFLLWASCMASFAGIASLRSIRDSKILESLAQMPGGALCFWTPGAATKSVERQIICMAEYGFLDRFEWVYWCIPKSVHILHSSLTMGRMAPQKEAVISLAATSSEVSLVNLWTHVWSIQVSACNTRLAVGYHSGTVAVISLEAGRDGKLNWAHLSAWLELSVDSNFRFCRRSKW